MDVLHIIALLCQGSTGVDNAWEVQKSQAVCHNYYVRCYQKKLSKRVDNALSECVKERSL